MGKYRHVLDDLDPMGRQNRIKRDLERALREERAARRTRLADLGDDYTMTPEGPQEVAPMPTPDGLTITARTGAIEVVWSGSASEPIPTDFDRLAVHVSKVSGYTPTQGTEVTAIGSPSGGVVTYEADAEVPYYVRSALVSLRGEYGPFTDEVAVTPEALAVDGAAVWNPNATRIANPQTIPTSTVSLIGSWTDVEADGVTVQSDRCVVTYPGIYYISASLRYATNTSGRRSVRIHVNGVEVQAFAVGADTLNTYVSATVEVRLAVGDEVTVYAYQSSGAGLPIVDDGSGGPVQSGNQFSMHRISA